MGTVFSRKGIALDSIAGRITAVALPLLILGLGIALAAGFDLVMGR